MVFLVRDEVLVQILASTMMSSSAARRAHIAAPSSGEHLELGVELSGVDFAFAPCLEAPLARQYGPAESMTSVTSPRSRSYRINLPLGSCRVAPEELLQGRQIRRRERDRRCTASPGLHSRVRFRD